MMKLDLRYKLHQAINTGTLGVFGPVMVLFCLHKGMDLYQVGLFFGVYFLAITCFELPSGAWADKFGRLRVFYCAKLFDCLNFSLLIFFDAIELIILASFIGGVGRALGSGAMEAWYVELLKQQRREAEIGQKLSSAHAWSLVGMACGAIMGAGLVQFFGEQYNADNPYLLALLAVFFLHAIILFSMPYFFCEGEKVVQVRETVNSDLGIIRKTLHLCWSEPMLRAVLLMQLLFGVLLTSIQTYWQPTLQTMLKADADILMYGLVAALFYLSAALAANLVKKRLSNSHKPLNLMLFGLFALSSIVMIAMAFSSSVGGFVGLYLVFGFFIFAAKPLLATTMHQQVCDKYRATSLSLLSLMFNLGALLVGLLFSLIADKFGIYVLWCLMGGLGLIFTLLLKSRYAIDLPAALKSEHVPY